MIKNIVTSLLITFLVSLFTAGLAGYVFDLHYMKTFVLVSAIQIIGFYIWNTILQTILRIRIEQEQTKQAEYFTRQGVDANCAHCNVINFIPVSMDQENEFNCMSCNKENAVYIDITVAQKTDIIDKQNLSIKSYIKDRVDAEQSIK